MERRKSPRIGVEVPARVWIEGEAGYALTRDLSLSGARLHPSVWELPPGSSLLIDLLLSPELPLKGCRLAARVVRRDEDGSTALDFGDPRILGPLPDLEAFLAGHPPA